MKKNRKKQISIEKMNLKEVMAARGVTNQELAERIPTSAPHVSRIISGKRPCLSLPIAIRIAQILKTPVEKLFIISIPENDKVY